jgi:hypothetical protein
MLASAVADAVRAHTSRFKQWQYQVVSLRRTLFTSTVLVEDARIAIRTVNSRLHLPIVWVH